MRTKLLRMLAVLVGSLMLIGMVSSNPKSPCLGRVYPGIFGNMVLDCSDGNPCRNDGCGYYEGSSIGLVCACEIVVTPACCDVYVDQGTNNVIASGTCGGGNCLGIRGANCVLYTAYPPEGGSYQAAHCIGA